MSGYYLELVASKQYNILDNKGVVTNDTPLSFDEASAQADKLNGVKKETPKPKKVKKEKKEKKEEKNDEREENDGSLDD